jgi:hypothetical protein
VSAAVAIDPRTFITKNKRKSLTFGDSEIDLPGICQGQMTKITAGFNIPHGNQFQLLFHFLSPHSTVICGFFIGSQLAYYGDKISYSV